LLLINYEKGVVIFSTVVHKGGAGTLVSHDAVPGEASGHDIETIFQVKFS
jgi:hypothetical protein